MTLNSWTRKGSYIPFPLPLKIDSLPPALDEAPVQSLCLNQFYVPYLLGAMKALAREETYVGDPDNVHAMIDAWRRAEHLFVAGCGAEGTLDWYAVFGITIGGQTFQGDPNADAGRYRIGWESGTHVFHSSGALNPQGYVAFRDNNGAPCGVHVRRWGVWGGGLGGVMTITDCLDNQTATSVLDAYDSHGDYPAGVDLKKIDWLAGTSQGGIYFVADGPIVCGVA